MSVEEYYDLYLSAQNNPDAPYHVISFDIVNSKQYKDRYSLQKKINSLIRRVYIHLLIIEIELKKQILIKDKRFIHPWDWNAIRSGNFIDPLIYGDCFQITVLRNSISKDDIINLVNLYKKELNIDVDFHISDGYYETNEIEESTYKCYRADCLKILESNHKEEYSLKRSLYEKEK